VPWVTRNCGCGHNEVSVDDLARSRGHFCSHPKSSRARLRRFPFPANIVCLHLNFNLI
jgi:hypothetical protein